MLFLIQFLGDLPVQSNLQIHLNMKKFVSLIFVAFFVTNYSFSQEIVIGYEVYAQGFNQPVDIAHTGDDRLFVVEQSGIIKIIDQNGNVMPNPFLDITNLVLDNASERGLLGLAFHPDYPNTNYFYVNYTKSGGHTRVSRFSTANDPNTADPNSEFVIMDIDQPEWNHNGGGLKFGPDGYLYIGTGDGGSGGDPWNNSQNPTELLGKMLRIDVDGGSPYAIPPDNPFVNDMSVLDEIWAIGLRNPWRYSFDRETGDLWIGDVGQNAWEEVDMQPANSPGGENYGWRCNEGYHIFNVFSCDDNITYTDPVHEYANSNGAGKSITGGFVYRGSEYPGMYGHYIYADYVSGRVWSIKSDGNGGWNNVELDNWTNNQISSFGENKDGELFMAARGQGIIYQVVDECQGFDAEIIAVTNISCFGAADGSIELQILGDNEPFQITWSNGLFSPHITDLTAGIYSVEIEDAIGCVKNLEFEILEPNEVALHMETVIGQSSVWLQGQDGYANYQWYLDGNPIAGATGSSYEASSDGVYTLEVTDDTGCLYITHEYIVIISSTNEIPNLEKVNIIPNPVKDNFTLQLESTKSLKLTLIILDISGKTNAIESIEFSGSHQQSFDISKYASGVYLLKLETEEGQFIKRIVKE